MILFALACVCVHMCLTQYPAEWPWLESNNSDDDVPSTAIVLGSIGGAIGLVVLTAIAIIWLQRNRYRRKLAAVGKRSRSIPKLGDTACALVSDVEASTALYEADAGAMTAAMRLHNNTFRYLLKKHYGFEKHTEGDSFTALFHNVNDAISFSMALQRTLLDVRWPEQLFGIHVMRNDTVIQPAGVIYEDDKALFRGLRVRIGIHNGIVGECELVAKEICDAVRSGGQVVVSETAWFEASSSRAPPEKEPAVNLCGLIFRVGEEDKDIKDGDARYNGSPQSSVKTSKSKGFAWEASGRRTRRFWPTSRPSESPRSPTPPSNETAMEQPMPLKVEVSSSRRILSVECLGEVFMKSEKPLQNMPLKSVLPQSLRARAPIFEPLKVMQLTPAFYDAPCARLDPEEYVKTTIVFIYVTGIEPMLFGSADKGLATATMKLLETQCIDKCAHEYGGYKCEAFSNGFLMAFASPLAALGFSIFAHKVAMYVDWRKELLEKEEFSAFFVRNKPMSASSRQASDTYVPSRPHRTDRVAPSPDRKISSSDTKLVMRGPRMKIGLYEGTPTSCSPHPHTGRASYTGQLMNRAARIASKAPSGHTLTSSSTWKAAIMKHDDTAGKSTLSDDSGDYRPDPRLRDGLSPNQSGSIQSDDDEYIFLNRSRTLSFESTLALSHTTLSGGDDQNVDIVDVRATELGEMKFKGVQEPIEIVHVYDSVLHARPFPVLL